MADVGRKRRKPKIQNHQTDLAALRITLQDGREFGLAGLASYLMDYFPEDTELTIEKVDQLFRDSTARGMNDPDLEADQREITRDQMSGLVNVCSAGTLINATQAAGLFKALSKLRNDLKGLDKHVRLAQLVGRLDSGIAEAIVFGLEERRDVDLPFVRETIEDLFERNSIHAEYDPRRLLEELRKTVSSSRR